MIIYNMFGHKFKYLKGIILAMSAVLLISVLSASAAVPADSDANLIAAAREMKADGKVQLNFKDMELSKFLRFMSELLGENIVLDQGAGGRVSIVSPKPMTMGEAREVMLSVLEMNNLSIQDMGGYSKVFPAGAGPTVSNNVVKSSASVTPGESITVQVVPLKYVKAGYVVGPLKSAIPEVGAVPLENGDEILLTGKAVILNRAAGVIRALDVRGSTRTIKAINLEHADPKTAETQINAMSKDATSRLAGIMAVGDERTRRIILIGSDQSLQECERVLKVLDVPSRAASFHVYKLINADAKVTAEQLNSILSTAGKVVQDPKGTASASVVPDLPTNSLVFTASQEQFDSLKPIIAQLDAQPKQVLLRGLIAEVNLNKLNSAGIDWAAWGGGITGDLVAAGNAQLGSTAVPAETLELYDKLITREEIYTNPVTGNTYTTTNTDGKGLIYAYIKMLNKYDAINVLSMPRLMCIDNLHSSLQVGQVIPQLKGTLADTSNPKSVQNSYEYKDVGLILTVTPHIRNGNLVSLEIEQRVEDLLTTMGSPTPVTAKREVKTNVMVANGDTIIIGGLIREAEKVLKNRVPLLSYIPFIGNIFKSNEKQREKVELMIFLTPYILNDPQEAARMSNSIMKGEQGMSEAEKILLDRNHRDYEKSVKNESITKENLAPKIPESNPGPDTGKTDVKKDWQTRYDELIQNMEAKEQ